MGKRTRAFALLTGLALLAVVAGAGLTDPRGVPLPSIEKRWSIGIYAGPTPLALAPRAANPVLTASDVRDVRARFVADPFLVHDGPTWHMFFEVFNADAHHGDIGWATSGDGATWTYRRIVLDEPFHLSYPYVFADGSQYYMVPESAGSGSIRLYRADPFPDHWRFVRILVTGAGLVDPSVCHYNGLWWMLAGGPAGSLNVYHAPRPEGPWRPHRSNPVVRDAWDHARPGGRLVVWNGRLFRFAQDGATTYGAGVSAYEITSLTVERYAERAADRASKLTGSGRGWNASGMHHVDATAVSPTEWLAAVDGCRRGFMFGFRRLALRETGGGT
jgi:hypothetical protein